MDSGTRRRRWFGAALFALGLCFVVTGVNESSDPSAPSAPSAQRPAAVVKPTEGAAFKGAVPPLEPGFVVDRAGVLAPEARASLTNELTAFEAATGGGQMAVAIFTTLSGTPPEDAALAIARTWALGTAGADNGALLLLATEDRAVRLEVGRGWEGPLPDARAGDVVRAMTPFLRDGNWSEAALLCVREVRAAVLGEPHKTKKKKSGSGLIPLGFFLLFVGLFLFISSLESSGGSAPGGSTGARSGGGMHRPHRPFRPSGRRSGGGFRGGRGGHFGGGGAGGRF